MSLRGLLYAAFKLRLEGLGHRISDGDVFNLVDDAETAIATDATAQADSIVDNSNNPDPSQARGA